MDNKFYIKKFIRDDGATLAFDTIEVYLSADNTLLTRPDPETTSVNYTEASGGEMIRQKNPIFEQTINGLIIPKTTPYWSLVTRLNAFWKINHTYKIIYIEKSGDMFSVKDAWITGGIQIVPRPDEDYSDWTVTLAIGDQFWRQYAEDEEGNEIYANTVTLPLLSRAQGGEIWDSVGEKWVSVGGEWELGLGGVQNVYVDSTSTIYPVWVVEGSSINPFLQNNTTDTIAMYNGTVATGQTLIVNFETGVATLDGAIVSRNITGVVSCVPGDNTMGFNSDGGDAIESTISWNNILGG